MGHISTPQHFAFAGAAIALIALAACGGSGGTTGQTPAASPTAATSPQAEATVAPTTDRSVSTATAAPAATPTPLPAIVIASPASGATVHTPFHVTGPADTFEAVFRLQLRNGGGAVLLDQQVMATSGSGTRGSFDTTVTTSAKGAATLVAYERSPRDGSPINTVTVSITLG